MQVPDWRSLSPPRRRPADGMVEPGGRPGMRALAAAVALAATLGVEAFFLSLPSTPGRDGAEAPTRLVEVAPSPAARDVRAHVRPRTADPRTPGEGRRRQRVERDAPARIRDSELDAATTKPAAASVRMVADDAWPRMDGDPAIAPAYAGVFARRNSPLPDPATHVRLTFKPVVTGRWLAEQTARALGFWPPGYEDDPCPGIHRLAGYFRSNPDAARPDVVRAAIEAEASCSG